jgi:hypothetical protein
LEFLSKSLRNDKEIVLRALQNSGSQLEFVGEAFKNDKDIVLLACQDNIDNIKYASLEIREEIGNSHPVKFIMSEKLYNEVNNKIPFAEEIKIRKKKI